MDGQGMIHPIIFVKPFKHGNFLEEKQAIKQGRAQDYSRGVGDLREIYLDWGKDIILAPKILFPCKKKSVYAPVLSVPIKPPIPCTPDTGLNKMNWVVQYAPV